MEIANQEVELLLDTLTPKEKQAVLLRVYDEKKFKEIGIELSSSEARARHVYKRAIGKLRHPRRLKYLSYIGLNHTFELKEDSSFEGDNFLKWFEDYFHNPPDKYKIKTKPRKSYCGMSVDAPSVGIVYRGFKKEVLPGVFMYVNEA